MEAPHNFHAQEMFEKSFNATYIALIQKKKKKKKERGQGANRLQTNKPNRKLLQTDFKGFGNMTGKGGGHFGRLSIDAFH